MRLSKESILIIVIGVLDMVSTLAWIQSRGAQEANPVFQYYLALGPFWFAAMKLLLLAGPVFLLEWARRRRPRFALVGSRFAIAAYLLLYVVGVARLNPDLIHRHRQVSVTDLAQAATGMDDPRAYFGNDSAAPAFTPADSAIVYEGLR